MKPKILAFLLATATVACDPVCDIASLQITAEDGRVGIPCSAELQPVETAIKPPFGYANARTGHPFTVHTFRSSGRYRVAVQCEGYALASSADFNWALSGMGCGTCAVLGEVRVRPAAVPAPSHAVK